VDAVAAAGAAVVVACAAAVGCARAVVAVHSVAAAERDPRWAARLPCRGHQRADPVEVPTRAAARGRVAVRVPAE
jgi:hypothetical protein